jgi:hypothetical protein
MQVKKKLKQSGYGVCNSSNNCHCDITHEGRECEHRIFQLSDYRLVFIIPSVLIVFCFLVCVCVGCLLIRRKISKIKSEKLAKENEILEKRKSLKYETFSDNQFLNKSEIEYYIKNAEDPFDKILFNKKYGKIVINE